MKLTLTAPQPGQRYWWIRTACKAPLILTVKKVKRDRSIVLTITPDTNLNWSHNFLAQEVVWTSEEWCEAGKDAVCDYVPPLTLEDLAKDEELCPTCQGTFWEATQDSETLPCMWCKMEGKRKKVPEPSPTHARRSNLHPEIPIKESKR